MSSKLSYCVSAPLKIQSFTINGQNHSISSPPYLELRNPIGLGDQQVKQFNEILKKQAQELAGEV